jgi:hypothetical protein
MRRPSNAIGPPSGPDVGPAGCPGDGVAGVIWTCHSRTPLRRRPAAARPASRFLARCPAGAGTERRGRRRPAVAAHRRSAARGCLRHYHRVAPSGCCEMGSPPFAYFTDRHSGRATGREVVSGERPRLVGGRERRRPRERAPSETKRGKNSRRPGERCPPGQCQVTRVGHGPQPNPHGPCARAQRAEPFPATSGVVFRHCSATVRSRQQSLSPHDDKVRWIRQHRSQDDRRTLCIACLRARAVLA